MLREEVPTNETKTVDKIDRCKMPKSVGIVYYATEGYIDEAKTSVESLKSNNNLDVTLFTDVNSPPDIFDKVNKIDSDNIGFYQRIKCLLDSPYEKTLFIDSDTYVTGDVEPVFKMLDRFEIVARTDPRTDSTLDAFPIDRELEVPKSFPELNCGIIGFRKTKRVENVIKDWMERYEPFKDEYMSDQPFFREAIYNSDVDFGVLPSEYNCMFDTVDTVYREVVIFHGRPEEISTRLRTDDLDFDDIINQINEPVPSRRAIYPRLGDIEVKTRGTVYHSDFPLFRFIRAWDNHGLQYALEQSKNEIKKMFDRNT